MWRCHNYCLGCIECKNRHIAAKSSPVAVMAMEGAVMAVEAGAAEAGAAERR